MTRESKDNGLQRTAMALTFYAGLVAAVSAQGLINVNPPDPSEASEAVERPVTFSPAQAERGEAAYERYCMICHGENLNDGEFGGPPLIGRSFEESFGGLPVSALYGYIESAMPPDRPGRISDAARTDIVAYLLSRNGYSSGAALPGTYEAMDMLILEK